MAMYGISHTANTRVGNDFVRGVSGGERKRVTIAEATLSFAPLQCWDNSTRGTLTSHWKEIKLTSARIGLGECSRIL
jgi:ABC-type glutathione transport system ATPase component